MKNFGTSEKITDVKSFAEKVERISRKDIGYILNPFPDKIQSLKDNIPSPLQSFWESIILLFDMVSDYFSGDYDEVSWSTISVAVFSLAYFIVSVDNVPDLLPFIGYIDDATVIGLALNMIGDDVEEYKVWKSNLKSVKKKN